MCKKNLFKYTTYFRNVKYCFERFLGNVITHRSYDFKGR